MREPVTMLVVDGLPDVAVDDGANSKSTGGIRPRTTITTATRAPRKITARPCRQRACPWHRAAVCPVHSDQSWSRDLDSLAALMRQTPNGGGRRGR